MIEEMEIKMRNLLQEVSLPSSTVYCYCRLIPDLRSIDRFILARREISSMTSAVLMILKKLDVRRSCKKNLWVSSSDDLDDLGPVRENERHHMYPEDLWII